MALKHAPNRPAGGTLSAPAVDQQPLILVVEDDPALRKVIRSNLDERGYRIASAMTAADAVTLARAETPAALLLDVNLPDGSGWDVLRALRTQHQDVPTVVMSELRCSAPGWTSSARRPTCLSRSR